VGEWRAVAITPTPDIRRALLNTLVSAYVNTRDRDSDSLQAGRFGDRIQVGGEIFLTCPRQPWSSYTIGTGSLSRGKAAGVWRWPRTPSSAEVEERVDIYSPSGPSWLVLGWTWYFYPYLIKKQAPYGVKSLRREFKFMWRVVGKETGKTEGEREKRRDLKYLRG